MKGKDLYNILIKLSIGNRIKIRYFLYDEKDYTDIVGDINDMMLNDLIPDIELKNFYFVNDKQPTDLTVYYLYDTNIYTIKLPISLHLNTYDQYYKVCKIPYNRIIHVIPNYDRVEKIKKLKKGI